MPELSSRKTFTLAAGDWTLELGERTLVMGILNVTPDSFSDRGAHFEIEAAVRRAWQIAEEGADILDIGGESTRPGSQGVDTEEELLRVIPVLEALARGPGYPIPVSVDTSKARVARAALQCGAAVINDITALDNDPAIATEVAGRGAALVLMHMRGKPSNMQALPPSPDILGEIDRWAREAVARAEAGGVSSDKVILDPGIGFGKTATQNIEIIVNLPRLAAAGFPVLVGTSRKSFIGSIVKKTAEERVPGTCATVAASIFYGAHIVRVHDVAAARDVADVTDAIARAAGRTPEAG